MITYENVSYVNWPQDMIFISKQKTFLPVSSINIQTNFTWKTAKLNFVAFFVLSATASSFICKILSYLIATVAWINQEAILLIT